MLSACSKHCLHVIVSVCARLSLLLETETGYDVVTPRLQGRPGSRVSVTKNFFAKEPFRQKDGLKAYIYATCTITFMFMCVVVLETAVSAKYSAILFAPRVILRILSYVICYLRVLCRILPCEIAAWRLL